MEKLSAFIYFSLFLHTAWSQSPAIELVLFSSGYSSPIDIQSCGDSRLFIVQQNGYIYISDSAGNKNPTPFLNVTAKISTGSERGLLGMAFHPDYLSNGYFFIYYTKASPNTGNIIIARYKVDSLNADLADPNSSDVVIEINHTQYSNHNGGCIQFADDGYLYAGIGDGGSGGDPDENSQNKQKHLGKMLRLDIDVDSGFVVPPDNPFVNDSDYLPEIWAIGVRNPWRFCFDRYTNETWIGDVGQNDWEEVHFIAGIDTGGQNYGWDCYEGTHNYEPINCNNSIPVTWPVYEYEHTSGNNADCSETGGYVYRGCNYPNMYGRYIFADYCSGKIRATTKNNDGSLTTDLVGDELITGDEFCFSSFGEDRNAELYVADISHGRIYRVTDTSKASSAIILEAINSSEICATLLHAISGEGLSYQWSFNGAEIPGATDKTYFPVSGGEYAVSLTHFSGCLITSPAVTVHELPAVDITDLDSSFCVYLTSVGLNGTPAGGVFSGTGVSGSTFNPFDAGIGNHTLYYSYTDALGCTGIDSQSVFVDACAGFNDTWELSGVNIVPNPSDGLMTVLLKDTGISSLSLYDSQGRLLLTVSNDPALNGISSFDLDVRKFSSGIYSLKIFKGTQSSVHKVAIQHR